MADNEKNVTELDKTSEAAVETKAVDKAAEKKPAAKAAKPAAKKMSLGAKLKKAWKEFKAEFKKIVWSSKRDTFNNTVLVIVSMVVVAVCIGALDYLFSTLLSALGGLI